MLQQLASSNNSAGSDLLCLLNRRCMVSCIFIGYHTWLIITRCFPQACIDWLVVARERERKKKTHIPSGTLGTNQMQCIIVFLKGLGYTLLLEISFGKKSLREILWRELYSRGSSSALIPKCTYFFPPHKCVCLHVSGLFSWMSHGGRPDWVGCQQRVSWHILPWDRHWAASNKQTTFPPLTRACLLSIHPKPMPYPLLCTIFRRFEIILHACHRRLLWNSQRFSASEKKRSGLHNSAWQRLWEGLSAVFVGGHGDTESLGWLFFTFFHQRSFGGF